MYGTQYGLPEEVPHLQAVRDDWLLPALGTGATKRVLEIGAGGGRWSRYFPDRVASAVLVDGTAASEAAIRAWYTWNGFWFVVSPDGSLPRLADESIDYAWSFDTFVHFDQPLFDRYLAEIGRVLVPGGVLHLHYATLWPGHREVNGECFRYREEAEVAGVLEAAGLRTTGRRLEFHQGYGSVMVEAVFR